MNAELIPAAQLSAAKTDAVERLWRHDLASVLERVTATLAFLWGRE